MKRLAVFAALLVLSTAAYADGRRGSSVSVSANIATRGGVINSATVTQNAGAFAFSQVAQGDRAFIDAPKYDPLVVVTPGAFIMPFVGINGDNNDNARVVVFDPVGNFPVEFDD